MGRIGAHTGGHLDILVNNAGAAYEARVGSGAMSVRDAWNASWDVNVTGTHVLMDRAAPLLLKADDPRVLFLASGTSSLGETEGGELPALKRLNASPEAGCACRLSFSFSFSLLWDPEEPPFFFGFVFFLKKK